MVGDRCFIFYLIRVLCCSAYDVTIPAEGKALVKTDIAIALPEGCYGRVGMCDIIKLMVSLHKACHLMSGPSMFDIVVQN